MPDMVFTNESKKGQKFMKKKNLAFTLAEVLIVIGIIGVVAALTLPNLNHATGDKETVTRLMKAYSILNEANDRAIAIYGPLSTWKSSTHFSSDANNNWVRRIAEFLKVTNYCDEAPDINISCDSLSQGDMNYGDNIYQLSDGMTFSNNEILLDCDGSWGWNNINDFCSKDIYVDINGPTKGENKEGRDIFVFEISDSIGMRAYSDIGNTLEEAVNKCLTRKDGESCTWWVMEYGNLDYLKADSSGKCNDSNIILDGVTNTSCH